MRTRSVVPVLVALAAGLTAAAAVRRFVGRHRATALSAAAPAVHPGAVPVEAVGVEAVREAVVLPFTRPVPAAAAAPVQPAVPARCGESGGRTKAGAPCAARATSAGRCHHHRIAV